MQGPRTSRWQSPIIGWLLVGFHAKHGHQVECAELGEEQTAFILSRGERSEAADWLKQVTLRALPDGAHERDADVVYFSFQPGATIGTWYGVACYRQRMVDRARLANAEEVAATARGLVQKSVVLLSRWPLYALLARRLEPVMAEYFVVHDFGQVNCFRTLVAELNGELANFFSDDKLVHPSLPHGLHPYVFGETCLQRLLTLLGRDLLRLLKLVLLEKRILVAGSPIVLVGRSILSLISVFPGEWAAPSAAPGAATSDAAAPHLAECCKLAHLPFGLFDLSNRRGAIQTEFYVPLTLLRRVLLKSSDRSPRGWIAGVSTQAGRLYASACRPARVFERSPVRSLLVPQRALVAENSVALGETSPPLVQAPAADAAPSHPWTITHPDALVDLDRGRAYFTPAVASVLTLTRKERRFMDVLMAANATGTLNEEKLREQLQWYVLQLALSAAAWGDRSLTPFESLTSSMDEEFFWQWSRETVHFRHWQATWEHTKRSGQLSIALQRLGERLSIPSSSLAPEKVDELASAFHLDSMRRAFAQWWWQKRPSTNDKRCSVRTSSPGGPIFHQNKNSFHHLDRWETFHPSESSTDSEPRIPGNVEWSDSVPARWRKKPDNGSDGLASTDITLLPERSPK